MAITYEEFQKALNGSGLSSQFSQYDLDLAKQYPEFGTSILNLKQNWQNAATDEEKQALNDQANALRSSYGNYTGGADGSQYVSTGLLNNETDERRGAVSSYAPFSYDVAAPTYTNQYADQQAALLDAILNREDFSWSKETDPQWAPLKKEYLREGDRATANALAQASAASGGRASSYAVNAASQAGDYYATQLTDKLPELYQQAYERYLAEQQQRYDDLNAVNAQEQLDYAKYLNDLSQYNTDRSFAYNDYTNQYNMLQNAYENAMNQQQTEFNQNLTTQQYQDEIAAAQRELAQNQIDAILSAGGTPSAELLAGSGYSDEYAKALAEYYARQQAQAAASSASGSGSSSGSSGGSSGSSGGSSGMTLTTAKQAASAGVFNDSVLSVLRANGYTDDMLEAIYGYTGDGGTAASGTLKYANLSGAAKKISDYMDSDLTWDYNKAIQMIEALPNDDEKYYLLKQMQAYVK